MGSCSLLSGFLPVNIFRVICIKFVLFSIQFLYCTRTHRDANYCSATVRCPARLSCAKSLTPHRLRNKPLDPRNLATNSARSWLGEFPVLLKNMHIFLVTSPSSRSQPRSVVHAMAACAAADVGPRVQAAAPSGESWQRINPLVRCIPPSRSFL